MPLRSLLALALAAFVAPSACSASVSDAVSGPPAHTPKWPISFSAPFGMYNLDRNPVVNASSVFYFDWSNPQRPAQLIDYVEQCFPTIPGSELEPCRILFLDSIYYSQPSLGIDCCLWFEGVGPSPPDFLAGFTWNGTAVAKDYYGTKTETNYWIATPPATGFTYWTDVKTNHDIWFKDGASGPYWAWGKFNVGPQDQTLFKMPGTAEQCATKCPPIMDATAPVKEPMVRRALANHAMQKKMLSNF